MVQPYLPLQKAIADCYEAIANYIQVVLNNSTSVSVWELQQVKRWQEKLQLAKDASVTAKVAEGLRKSDKGQ